MQTDSGRAGIPDVLSLRVVLIPAPSPNNDEDYRVRIENIATGEIYILDTLDAFEERIASLVDPLFS